MANYRTDTSSRCGRCQQKVEPEGLIFDGTGVALCSACRIDWADRELLAARTRDGARRCCPQCQAPSIHCHRSGVVWRMSCKRCGRDQWLLNVVGYLVLWLLVLASPFASFGAMLVVGALAGILVLRDVLVRGRYRKATPDEVEKEDSRVVLAGLTELKPLASSGAEALPELDGLLAHGEQIEPSNQLEESVREQSSRHSAR
ncbi:MAG: hypothetical protein U0271_21575 [Polyangiaceae bacterium]